MRSESSEVIGYKVNTQKSVVFLCSTNNEQLETNIKNNVLQCLCQMKYLGVGIYYTFNFIIPHNHTFREVPSPFYK